MGASERELAQPAREPMANHHSLELEMLQVEHGHLEEALQCLLHTIMFNRALGMVTPREVASEKGLDICWVDCGDPNVRRPLSLLRSCTGAVSRPGLRGVSCRQVEDHFKKRLGAFAKGFEASYARTPDQPPPQQVRPAPRRRQPPMIIWLPLAHRR